MPKAMALIENDFVVNIIWCRDDTDETNNIKNVGNNSVKIGDGYLNGEYFRKGKNISNLNSDIFSNPQI